MKKIGNRDWFADLGYKYFCLCKKDMLVIVDQFAFKLE
jgi:hypothetical protein